MRQHITQITHSKRGYTLVELLIVIVIIGVLVAISVAGYGKIQADSRDKERRSNAIILSEALEKYYEKNGEYPSVVTVTDTNINNVKTKLSLTDVDVLVMPKSPMGTITSITATDASINKLAYNGESVHASETDQCQTNVSGGCDKFRLEWIDEQGHAQAINSRHTTRAILATLSPPTDPVIALAPNGSNLRGTVTSSTCVAGTLEYRITINTSSTPPDMTIVSWQSNNTFDFSSPVSGTTYYGYAMARCVSGTSSNAENPNIATDDYTYTPAGTPSMLASWSGTSAVGTASVAPACGAGLTTKYRIEYKIDTTTTTGTWMLGQDYAVTNSYAIANAMASNPRKFSFRALARCDTGATPGAPSGFSNTDYVISAPVAPTVTNASNASATYWSWADAPCPVGTAPIYRGTWTGNYNAYPAMAATITSGYGVTSTSQGFTYGLILTTSCGGSSAKVLSINSADSTYARPMVAPAHIVARSGVRTYQPSGGSSTTNYIHAQVRTTEPGSCPSGTERRIGWQVSINDAAWTPAGSVSSDRLWSTGVYQDFYYNSDLDDNDKFEGRFGLRCRNPYTGVYSGFNPSGRYDDRMGNILITSSDGDYHTLCDQQDTSGSDKTPSWCTVGYNSGGSSGTCNASDEDYCWGKTVSRGSWQWTWWPDTAYPPAQPNRPPNNSWGLTY